MTGNALTGWGGASYTVTKCTRSKGKYSCPKSAKVASGDLSSVEGASSTEQFFLCPDDTYKFEARSARARARPARARSLHLSLSRG